MFDEMKGLVEELESDSFVRGSSDWPHVMERFQENIERMREILDEIE